MESGSEKTGQEKILAAAQSANADLGLGRLGAGPPDTAGSLLRGGAGVAAQMIPSLLLGPEAGIIMKLLTAGGGSVAGGAISRGTITPETAGLDFLLGAGSEGGAQLGGAATRQISGKAGLLAEGKEAEQLATEKLNQARTNAVLAQRERIANVRTAAEADALKGQESYDVSRVGAIEDQKARLADVTKAAEADALKARQAATEGVQTQRDLLDREVLKHSEKVLPGLRDDVLEKQVRDFLGAPAPVANPTIESLSERVAPVRESAERSVRGVFRSLSGKFEEKLTPYYELPVTGNFKATVDTERALLESNKETVGKNLQGLMNQITSLDPGAGVKLDQLPPALRHEYERLQRSGTMAPEAIDRHIGMLAKGIQGPNQALMERAFAPADVRAVDGIRRKLTGVIIGNENPVEKRVANRLIQSLDESLGQVLPENIQADWSNLRREWREANNVFSPNFRSTLFKASTPAEVADVLYGSSKGSKASRVLTVIGKTPKDELPLLRGAFAERMTQGDVVKNVEGMNPQVWQSLFGGSGFANPREFVDTMRTNLVERLNLDAVTANPMLTARFNERMQQGLRSFGVRKYQQAVDAAEAHLRSVKNPGQAITDALAGELTPEQAADVALRGKTRPDVGQAVKAATDAEYTLPQAADVATAGMERPEQARVRGGMAGMKTPLLGKGMQGYIEHRTAFHTAMGLATLGAVGGGMFHHPVAAAIPLAYIGGSKAANWALTNPRIGKIWYNALTSKNWEQAGFWLGRLAAASLTEGIRSADDSE